MASGDPVTSISTAPQKQLPECVMTYLFFRLYPIEVEMIGQADLRQGTSIDTRFL
jgi:hypothetical protein